jgi:hypothetical protein
VRHACLAASAPRVALCGCGVWKNSLFFFGFRFLRFPGSQGTRFRVLGFGFWVLAFGVSGLGFVPGQREAQLSVSSGGRTSQVSPPPPSPLRAPL